MSDKKKMGFFQKTKNMTDTNLLLATLFYESVLHDRQMPE